MPHWFDFANKSRNFNNVEGDFSQYNNDEIMAEVIKRLRKDRLAPKEYQFVSDMPLYEAYYLNQQIELEEIAEKAKKAEKKAEKTLLLVEQQKLQAEQKLQVEHQKLLKGIENLLRRGDTIESIAELLVRSVVEITAFVAQIQDKKP